MKITGGDIAKRAGLELDRYSDDELRTLDAVGDGKIDETEAAAAVRFADVDGNGMISAREQRALDHVLGKETSLPSAEAFADLHEGRIDALEREVGGEQRDAHASYDEAYEDHDAIVNERARMLSDSRDALQADGIPVPTDSSARILAEMQQLGDPARLSGPQRQRYQALERQHDHAQLKEEFNAGADAAYQDREQAAGARRAKDVETWTVAALADQARARLPTAVAIRDAAGAVKAAAALRGVRALARNNPQVQRDAAALVKARHVRAAVTSGKLDRDDVNVRKLDGDIAKLEAKMFRHTQRLENLARGTVKQLESPEFKTAMEALPPDERAAVEGGLHALIADTRAGEAFFQRNLLPALKGAPDADPYFVGMLKGGAQYSKLGLQSLQTWGGHIAKHGGKDAVELLNNGVSQALGIKPSQVGRLHDAMEYANKHGVPAAQARLAADPELGKLAGGFDKISKGVAFATGVVAAYDLHKQPDLRNSLAAAGSAVELTGIAAGAARSSKALATYARFAGKVAPGIDVLVGGADTVAAVRRADTAGAVGGGMQVTGGMMMLAAASTGVGLPVAVIGGALSVGGAVVGAIWGDSDTKKWLKDNAPEYLK